MLYGNYDLVADPHPLVVVEVAINDVVGMTQKSLLWI